MWTLFSQSFESIHTLQLKEELREGGGGAKSSWEQSLSLDLSSEAFGGDLYESCDLCCLCAVLCDSGSLLCKLCTAFISSFLHCSSLPELKA